MSSSDGAVDVEALDLEELAEWLVDRRWFGSKARELTQVGVVDMPLLDPDPPPLRIALVAATFGTGAHEIYQVPLVIDGDTLPQEARIASLGDGAAAYDLLAERRDPPRLLDLIVA